MSSTWTNVSLELCSPDENGEYLFHGLSSEHQWMFFLHTYTVLDPEANATETCRIRFCVGDVEPRLNRNTLSSFELGITRMASGVVNVKTNIVSNMMWEKNLKSFAGHIKA